MVKKEELDRSYIVFVKNANDGNITRIAFPEDVQIGLANKPSELLLTGRLSVTTTNYKCNPNSSITISNDTVCALVEPTTTNTLGTLNVKLPNSPREGQLVIVKDSIGSANTHNILITSSNNANIDGSSNKLISISYDHASFVYKDNEWLVISEGGSSGSGTITGVTAGLGLSGGGTSGNVTLDIDDNIVATVSGTTFTGVTNHNAGLSGSLTQLTDGTSYLVAGPNIAITTGSNGSITIEGIGGGGGAPSNATFVTLTTNGSLSNERVLTPGTGIIGADAGANSTYTISINDNIVATVSGTTFTGVTKHNAGLSGSLTQLTDGTSYLIAGTNIGITSGSNGSITISNSQTLEWNERLTGTTNGINTTFNLAYTPKTALSIMLFLNGMLLEQGASNDFTISGTTVTMSEAPLPDSKLTATYSR